MDELEEAIRMAASPILFHHVFEISPTKVNKTDIFRFPPCIEDSFVFEMGPIGISRSKAGVAAWDHKAAIDAPGFKAG